MEKPIRFLKPYRFKPNYRCHENSRARGTGTATYRRKGYADKGYGEIMTKDNIRNSISLNSFII
jgi:hypothetical protein